MSQLQYDDVNKQLHYLFELLSQWLHWHFLFNCLSALLSYPTVNFMFGNWSFLLKILVLLCGHSQAFISLSKLQKLVTTLPILSFFLINNLCLSLYKLVRIFSIFPETEINNSFRENPFHNKTGPAIENCCMYLLFRDSKIQRMRNGPCWLKLWRF